MHLLQSRIDEAIIWLEKARNTLPGVPEAAAHGEATTITKHGRPATVVVRVADAQRLYGSERPSFADLLMSIPKDLETERDPSPLRLPDI